MVSKTKLFCEYLVFNLDATYVLLILTLGYFSSQYDRYIYTVSQISFVNYNSYEYGLIAGPIFSVVYTITAIAIGSLFQKCRVWGMSLVMGFWSIIIALVSITTSFWQVAILRAGLAVGEAGYTPLATSLLGDYFPQRIRGTAMGVFIVGLYAGYGCSLAGGKAIDNEVGWRWSYFIAGILPAILSLVMYCTIHEPDWSKSKIERIRTEREMNPDVANDDAYAIHEDTNTKRVIAFSYWMEHKSLIAISIAAGIRNLSGLCFGNFIAVFFSPLFVTMPEEYQEGKCYYSYNSNYYGTQVCDSYYPYCVAERCVNLSSSPWHNKGLPISQFEIFMLLTPVVAGSLGTITGGLISDKYAKQHGPSSRLLFLALSTLVASPFAFGTLLLPYPLCFISLSAAYFFGEMWSGVLLALIVDIVPRQISAFSLATMLALRALIGGLGPFLVPVVRSAYQTDYTFIFEAANVKGNSGAASGHEVDFDVTQPSSSSLEYALLWLYAGSMAISSFFFLCAYFTLKKEEQRSEKHEYLYTVDEEDATRYPLLSEEEKE
mmetsp:Transcript_9109/g.12069  ORF Transcript_9109/g.12069 Transcript_9109/m.12069 type:complete len:547 (+) Transcript_9109:94-1734(+)